MARDAHLLTDLALRLTHSELRPVYQVAETLRRVPNQPRRHTDLATVSGRDNLAQAIVLRLLTPRGELEGLGHPGYGSRLHRLIGRGNTATNRNLARLYILESLAEEPRIEEVETVDVVTRPERRSLIDVTLEVRPIGSVDTVTVGPFTLELEG